MFTKKIHLNIKGFTLVELMVVVAIIGILASIAVPSYRKYQAKARTGEAPLALAGLYTGEASVFAIHGTFVGCVKLLGMSKPIRSYYVTGFDTAENTGKDTPSSLGTSCPAGTAQTIVVGVGDIANTTEIADTDSFVVPYTLSQKVAVLNTAGADLNLSVLLNNAPTPSRAAMSEAVAKYTAISVGSISSASTLDIWQISETKKISVVQYGY